MMPVLEDDSVEDVLPRESSDLHDLSDVGAVAGHDCLTRLHRGPSDLVFSHATHDRAAAIARP